MQTEAPKRYINSEGVQFVVTPEHLMVIHPEITFGISFYYSPEISKIKVIEHLRMNLRFDNTLDQWGPDKFNLVVDEICPKAQLELYEMTGDNIFSKIKDLFTKKVIVSLTELNDLIVINEGIETIVNEGAVSSLTNDQRVNRDYLLTLIDDQRKEVQRVIYSPKIKRLKDFVMVNPKRK